MQIADINLSLPSKDLGKATLALWIPEVLGPLGGGPGMSACICLRGLVALGTAVPPALRLPYPMGNLQAVASGSPLRSQYLGWAISEPAGFTEGFFSSGLHLPARL